MKSMVPTFHGDSHSGRIWKEFFTINTELTTSPCYVIGNAFEGKILPTAIPPGTFFGAPLFVLFFILIAFILFHLFDGVVIVFYTVVRNFLTYCSVDKCNGNPSANLKGGCQHKESNIFAIKSSSLLELSVNVENCFVCIQIKIIISYLAARSCFRMNRAFQYFK